MDRRFIGCAVTTGHLFVWLLELSLTVQLDAKGPFVCTAAIGPNTSCKNISYRPSQFLNYPDTNRANMPVYLAELTYVFTCLLSLNLTSCTL